MGISIDESPKLSVVIATHNNIEHLGECLDSILNQAFTDIEVIAVDVQSTDGTKELIAETAEHDKRVVFLADSMGSLGRARNIGMDYARAPYIFFANPDDYIEDDFLSYFYHEMEDDLETDIILCAADEIYEGSYGESLVKGKRDIAYGYGGHEESRIQSDCRVFRFQMYETAGVYRKSFLYDNGIRFYDMPGYGRQDAAFKLFALSRARVMFCDIVMYHRRVMKGNAISDSRNVFDVCGEYRVLKKKLQEDKDTWRRMRFAFWQSYYISNMELYEGLADELKASLSKRMQADLRQALENKELSRNSLDVQMREEILLLLESPEEYDILQMKRTRKNAAESKEYRALKERMAKRSEMQYANDNKSANVDTLSEQAAGNRPSRRLDRRWLMDEMSRDLAPLRLLLGLSQNEMGELLGISGSAYRSMESGKKEVSWDQYMALLFLFRYNDRTVAVTDTLGLYPEPLELRIKKGIVGNIIV